MRRYITVGLVFVVGFFVATGVKRLTTSDRQTSPSAASSGKLVAVADPRLAPPARVELEPAPGAREEPEEMTGGNATGTREWQGRPVERDEGQWCETTEHCGLGLVCKEESCRGCSADDDCLAGELCSLQRCLARDKVSCRSSNDCDAGEVCLVEGDYVGFHGNEQLIAKCSPTTGGA